MIDNAIAGAFAGFVGTILGYPLDIIKTHLQTSNQSISTTIRSIYKNSNIYGFYRGMSSPLLSLTILNTVNFSSYNFFKSNIKISDNYINIYLSSLLVGPLASSISTPFELVKTQLQLDLRNKIRLYKGSSNAFIEIFKEHGVRGLYIGHVINTQREMIFLSTYFTTYEYIKSLSIYEGLSSSNSRYSNIIIPIAGGLAGSLGWLISFPLDLVKANIQGNNIENELKRPTIAYQVLRNLIQKRGILGVYSGVSPSILRAFLVSSSRFSAYETAMWILKNNELA